MMKTKPKKDKLPFDKKGEVTIRVSAKEWKKVQTILAQGKSPKAKTRIESLNPIW